MTPESNPKMISVSEAPMDQYYLDKHGKAVIRLMTKNPDGSCQAVAWYERWRGPIRLVLDEAYPLREPLPGEVEGVMERHEIYTRFNRSPK